MNLKEKLIDIVGMIVCLALMIFFYFEYQILGFPDGHFTEFTHFQKNMIYPLFFGFSILFLVIFLLNLFNKNKSKWKKYAFILYLFFLALFFSTNYYFSLILENGQGG